MKKSLIVLLVVFAVAAFSFAAGQSESSKAASSSLVYATTDKVTDMDTASAYDFHTWDLFQNLDRASGL